MNRYFERIWQALSASDTADIASDVSTILPRTLPIIWLLGKTGAGKSSLVRCLTGVDEAELGNGFAPCTRTARVFDFPADHPLMRFLDTRGLGEATYDPADDLQVCRDRSHVIVVMARIDDPVQAEVADALAAIHKQAPRSRIIVVHNFGDLIPDPEQRSRASGQTQQQFENATGDTLPSIETALPPSALGLDAPGVRELISLLDEIMPEAALLLMQEDLRDAERHSYAKVRSKIFWYATAAGTTDVAPVVGAVAVPSIQAGMLRMLGKSYGMEWTRVRISEFGMALGMGIAGRFGGSYLARQLGKLVPGYGQTVGAAAAGTISFATTFALGRAAAYYLHTVQHGKAVSRNELRSLYKDALRHARYDKN